MRGISSKARIWIIVAAAVVIAIAGPFLYPHVQELRYRQQLLRVLNDGEPTQRIIAAIKLGRSGDTRGIPVLIAAITRPDGAQRPDESGAALCAVGAKAVPATTAALDASPAGTAALAEVLACIDDGAARNALAAFLAGGSGDRIGAAVSILSATRDERVADMIVQAAARSGRARRLVILASLGDPRGAPLNPSLAALLADAGRDQDPEVRAVAIVRSRWNQLNAPGSNGTWQLADPPTGSDLSGAANRARAILAERQQDSGFWQTAITPKPSFERARAERNTYLTPVIVDLLDPVADEAGLRTALNRARVHIGGEIEDNGLVRYYGVPREGDVSGRGCTISYDADDTALAWRVAPSPDREKLQGVLASLRRFRAQNGLYHTWLAPVGGLECVDRGDNPNPTDVAIQMHVLMLLSGTSAADAQSLCRSLRASIADDRIWVYYRQQPIVPILRMPDLERAGCPLTIPDRFLRTPIGGQGMWLAVAHALGRSASERDRKTVVALLEQIARDDFLAIRRSPPLLYQNDMTGALPAYYWSQEYGFAMWLRLYFEMKLDTP